MDRSTKATLITYNTRICLDGLSRISNAVALLPHISTVSIFEHHTDESKPQGFMPLRMGRGMCTAFSTDSDLEAFSRDPPDGSFATLSFLITALPAV